jgi:hypothetical protein
MTSSVPPSLEALPNPRGAAVRDAEDALAEARHAFDFQGSVGAPLLRAAHVLRHAGWLPAQRLADALVLASPFAGGEFAPGFSAALADFHAALTRRNLRELACSPTLFAHYRELSAHVANHTHGFSVAYEDLALAGRPIPPATIDALPAPRLAEVRARYESALLKLLRATRSADGALDEIDACTAELAGGDRYDAWRLASACARALRVSGRAASGEADAKRLYARCNLLLAEQGHGLTLAPRSFVRAALALLWRDYALYGAAAEDAEHVALLNDYGLTVDWHVAGTQVSEALWEMGAAQAEQAAVGDASAVRELGVLTVNVRAYEDFLQTAEASMIALAGRAGSGESDPSSASDAAYRLGAAAWALGLGHVALLSDALALALRRRAHAQDAGAAAGAPDAAVVAQAAEALRAMLLRVAAGVAPTDSSAPLAALTRAIERAAAPPPPAAAG